MTPPRLAYLLTAFPTVTETFVEGEVRALLKRGIPVDLYATRNFRQGAGEEDPRADRGLEVVRLPYLLSKEVAGACLLLLIRRPRRVLSTLVALLRGNAASPRYLLQALALFPKTLAFARRMEARGTGHVHGSWAHYPATCAYVVFRISGISFSFSAHAGLDVRSNPTFQAEKFAAARFVLTCNEANHRLLAGRHPGAAARIHNVYHGVSLADLPAPGAGPRPTIPEILSVGRLAPEKGFTDLLEAARILRERGLDFRLRIFGEGPLRPTLERIIGQLALADRVALEGVVPHRKILETCRRATVVALASYPDANGFQDGIANVLVEAMACGTPVVSTDYEGSRELLAGEAGTLVPVRDPRRLADALEELLRDPARRAELSRRGRERVERDFDRERNVEAIASRFREALSAARPSPSGAGATESPRE